MELFERQQFDFLLQTVTERYVERLEQRNEGALRALDVFRNDREAPGVWLSQYVDIVFQEFLLDSPAAACFILRALASRPMPPLPAGLSIEDSMKRAARLAFTQVLARRTDATLEQHSVFDNAEVNGD